MKQEHKLVAELYRYLAPFINIDRHFFVSLDGQAAMSGVEKGTFSDSTVPDLWFTLVGATEPTLIEAKTIDTNGRALLMKSQLQAWRSNGNGSHKPIFGWLPTVPLTSSSSGVTASSCPYSTRLPQKQIPSRYCLHKAARSSQVSTLLPYMSCARANPAVNRTCARNRAGRLLPR